MKARLICSLLLLLSFSIFTVQAQQKEQLTTTAEHNDWLKNKFSEQYQSLMPIVAVADMLYACNQARKTEPVTYQFKALILHMDKNRLAEKLIACLNSDDMQSDVALNFGLLGCFEEQLMHLPETERLQKMTLVKKAINALSHSERKKSFTQCVSAQAIHYLQ